MNEDPMDRLLEQARDEYNRPATPPREEMWAAIQAKKAARKRPNPWGKVIWPLGMAALLAMGFAIGRLTDRSREAPRGSQLATDPPVNPGPVSPAMAGAALQHLSRTETFLTGFRLEASARVPDPALLHGARDLLGTTRLLLDSPDLKDQRLRQLLRELEVVLAQVAQLQADPSQEDADLIVHELDEQGVLPRLRTTIPAGPAVHISGES
jgi:hypothetical protein